MNKKLLKILILLEIILLNFYCNIPEDKGDINYSNLKKIKIEMKLDTVLKIMGEPDTIIIDPFKNENYYYEYNYKSQWGSSDNYYIYISQNDSLVTSINYGN